jgi:hypothetical protein
MMGRVMNLIPTYFYINNSDYGSYFKALGLVSLLPMPLYFFCAKQLARDSTAKQD